MRTYTKEELSTLFGWHTAAIKAILSNIGVDADLPIEEKYAKVLAQRLRKPWPPAAGGKF